jgi:hypothetical protein
MMSINLNKLKSQQDVKAAKAKIRKAYLESLKKVEEAFKTKTKPDVKLPKLEKKLTKNQKKKRKLTQSSRREIPNTSSSSLVTTTLHSQCRRR